VVPDRVRLGVPVLFASREDRIERVVLRSNHDHMMIADQGVGDIYREGGLPTDVTHDVGAVDPDI